MRLGRRAVMRGSLLVAGGALLGAAASRVPHLLGVDTPPLGGGYAAAADVPDAVHNPSATVTYYVQTDQPVVAFTFDDGPGPKWTPMVLDALDRAQVPATFFMVGRNIKKYAALVRDRLDRHEVGNHSWSHPDFATLDLPHVRDEIQRADDAIELAIGRRPALLRPPFGHLGGSTVLAADSLGHKLVLWSYQMNERQYARDPAGQVRDVVDNVRPGDIVLAHDVGPDRRLVALRRLGDMFDGLRARGFRFATVSDLMAMGGRAAASA